MSPQASGADVDPPQFQEIPDFPDYHVDATSIETPTSALTSGSPFKHRPGYQRIPSINEQDTAYHGPKQEPQHDEQPHDHGLGIKILKRLPSASPQRSTPSTPASSNPLLSPDSARSHKAYRPLESDAIREGHGDWRDNDYKTEQYQAFVADSETQSLRRDGRAPTVQSFEPSGRLACSLFSRGHFSTR